MEKIKGFNELYNVYGHFYLREFSQIIQIEYERVYNDVRDMPEFNLMIILKGNKGLIQFNFLNVNKIEIKMGNQINGLNIEDISSLGWDYKKYKIKDDEDDRITGFAEECIMNIPK